MPGPVVWQSLYVVLVFCAFASDDPKLLRMKQFTSAAARLSIFRSGIVSLWAAALCALALAEPRQLFIVRQTADDMAWLLGQSWTQALAIIMLVIYFSLAYAAPLHCLMRPDARQKYSAAMRPLQYMLPVSNGERRWWILLSISAGMCEEVFFRGFLPQFLQGQLHGGWNMHASGAWALAALLFGGCHFYQGVAGMVRTALAGLMFSLLAILSGDLLLPIVLHILVDLGILWMYRPQSDHPAMAAQLIQGTSCHAYPGTGTGSGRH
jgi:membrane protease YdiL (CAAX protease family)